MPRSHEPTHGPFRLNPVEADILKGFEEVKGRHHDDSVSDELLMEYLIMTRDQLTIGQIKQSLANLAFMKIIRWEPEESE